MDRNLAKKLMNEEMMEVSKEEIENAARNLFKLYLSFKKAGFTRMEAMMLVQHVLDGAQKANER